MVIVDSVYGEEELVYSARSLATSQDPVGLDTPLQVEFGPAQGDASWPAILDATGKTTIQKAGTYSFNTLLTLGRLGLGGTSIMFVRYLVNGVQVGGSGFVELDTERLVIPLTFNSPPLKLKAGDYLTLEIVRDSSGVDAGGLKQATPTLSDWNPSSCAITYMSRIIVR